MKNNYFQNQMIFEHERFAKLTEYFTQNDWRECRDKNYWESDKIQSPLDKLKYKNHCIENYLSIKTIQDK